MGIRSTDARAPEADSRAAGRPALWGLSWLLATLLLASIVASASAQVMGEEAEMDRLQARAEEAIANRDADGAAMNMGKAALMASHLARRYGESLGARLYHGAEGLFRSEEQAYRAWALFERGGGQPPAAAGVCGSLEVAVKGVRQAGTALRDLRVEDLTVKLRERRERLQADAVEWVAKIDELRDAFGCTEITRSAP